MSLTILKRNSKLNYNFKFKAVIGNYNFKFDFKVVAINHNFDLNFFIYIKLCCFI